MVPAPLIVRFAHVMATLTFGSIKIKTYERRMISRYTLLLSDEQKKTSVKKWLSCLNFVFTPIRSIKKLFIDKCMHMTNVEKRIYMLIWHDLHFAIALIYKEICTQIHSKDISKSQPFLVCLRFYFGREKKVTLHENNR